MDAGLFYVVFLLESRAEGRSCLEERNVTIVMTEVLEAKQSLLRPRLRIVTILLSTFDWLM